jgi:SAM-dependent methyltransferase
MSVEDVVRLRQPLPLEALTQLAEQVAADPGLVAELADAGFTPAGVCATLMVDSLDAVVENSALLALAQYVRDAPVEDACAALVRLFICNAALTDAQFVRTVPDSLRRRLVSYRLVGRRGTEVFGRVSIAATPHSYLLSDQIFMLDDDGIRFAEQRVMPPHASSLLLLRQCLPMRAGQSLLDLGCGSGYLGLELTARGGYVLGVDIDPRAVAFSRANAVLNERHADYAAGLDSAGGYRPGTFDEVLFNSPSGPTFEQATGRYRTSPAADWLELAGRTATDALRPGGRLAVFAILLPTSGGATELDELARLRCPQLRLTRLTQLDNPTFAVTAAEIAAGRIPGRSLWLRTRASEPAFLDYLAEQRIVEIVPCVIEYERT